jgi:hypothetical protein
MCRTQTDGDESKVAIFGPSNKPCITALLFLPAIRAAKETADCLGN